MLRTRLLAATAFAALIAAPALAQEATPPAQTTMPDATAPAAPPAPVPTPGQTTPTETMPTPAAQAPATENSAAQTQTAETPAASGTVVDVLRASGQFTTLLSALDQAQLTETLSTRPAISIFAPTDAAFAALPEAERTRLMDPANANELRQILLYHVIVADVTPDQIEGRRGGVPTAAQNQIQLDGTGEMIKADDATVVSAELDASNGAVFPIDKVLNPAASQAAMGDEETVDSGAAAAESTTEATPADDAATETTTPADPGTTAPNGQPAATTTTVASPPVANPTDGQMDNPADPAVNPSATPPVQTPDAVDGGQEGDPTPQ